VPDVAAAGSELAAALRPHDRPALVLWGRHDPYLPVALAARQREAFPHAEIRVLEGSGHWPFVDDPAAVAAAITAFLEREPAEDEIGTAWRPVDISMTPQRR
jgi:pimeloyl-ACP methyl ester carboxylesterase